VNIRNSGWYNLNEQRCWPLADFATELDDQGRRLPSDAIADLNIRFPKETADTAFISALTISPGIVSLVISADNGNQTPLLSLAVPRPVEPGVQYVLVSEDGVSFGRVVFGSRHEQITEPSQTLSLRFSTAAQSRLAYKAARPFRLPELTSLGVAGDERKLTGRVRLLGGSDVETRAEVRVIEGRRRTVGVVRLKDKSESAQSSLNLSETYAGECGQRPESKNCRDGIPIETINEVTPDCCGRIFIEMQGGADVFLLTNDNLNGVGLDFPFNLAQACVTPARLPDARGRLPNEYPDQCAPIAQPLVSISSEPAETLFTALRTWDADGEDTFQLHVDSGEWKTETGEVPFDPADYNEIVQVFRMDGRVGVVTAVPHGLSEYDLLFMAVPGWKTVAVERVLDDRSILLSARDLEGTPRFYLRTSIHVSDSVAVDSGGLVTLFPDVQPGEELHVLTDTIHKATVVEAGPFYVKFDDPSLKAGLLLRHAQAVTAAGMRYFATDASPDSNAALLINATSVQAVGVERVVGERADTVSKLQERPALYLPSRRTTQTLARVTSGSGLHRAIRPQPATCRISATLRLRASAGRRFNASVICDFVSPDDYIAVTADFDARRSFRITRIDRGKQLLQTSVGIPRGIAATAELQLELSLARAENGQRYVTASLFAPATGEYIALQPVPLTLERDAMAGVQTRGGSLSLSQFTITEPT
jgi:hypothetical protein